MPSTRRRDLVDLAKCAAVNGKGHALYKSTFYTDNGVPAVFAEEVKNLECDHPGVYDNDGQVTTMRGIYSLTFHFWVAQKIAKVDASFSFDHYMGKGFQAQEIQRAVGEWALGQK